MLGGFDGHGSSGHFYRHATAVPAATDAAHDLDAKAAKNFAEADRIRKLLLEQGIVLKDAPGGTTWEAAP